MLSYFRYMSFLLEITMETELCALAGRVAARMAELGITQADVARRGRFNATFVSDLLRGKKLTLHSGNYARLARALLTTETYLRIGTQPSDPEIGRIAAEVGWQPPPDVSADNETSPEDQAALDQVAREFADEGTRTATTRSRGDQNSGRFPVYRSGGRYDGASIMESFPLDQLSLPQPWQANGLYAIAISDTAMSPRYEPGDLAYAHKNANGRPKDYVSIRVKGRIGNRPVELAYVRQLLHEGKDEVIVRQISPSIETRFARDSVVGIDRILLSGEPIDDIGF